MAVTGAADGSIIIEAKLDTSSVDKGFGSIQKQANGLSNTLSKLGKLMASAFAVGAIVKFGKEAIELGSNVQEVQNVVDVAFGDMNDKVETFADSAITKFGMSELAAKKTASTYMSMAKGMGITDDAASEMSLALTGLTGDVASFYNISQEAADTKLKSVFTGETETLKDLGIVMTEANLAAFALSEGITKNYNDMSQSEKVMLRYNYVTKQLSLASGDFARTQDSWANQTRILSMQWQEFMSIIGSALTTILTPLVKMLNSLLQYLIAIGERISNLVSSAFGVTAQGSAAEKTASSVQSSIDGSAESQEGLTDAVKETAKEQKKAIAGFDEIQKITESTKEEAADAGIGGISAGVSVPAGNSGGALPVPETSPVMSALDGVIAKISGFFASFSALSEPITKAFNSVIEGAGSLKETLATAWNSISGLGSPISAWFTQDFMAFVGEFLVLLGDTFGKALSGLGVAFNDLWSTVVFPTLSLFVTNGLPKITEFLTTALGNFESFRDTIAMVLGDVWNIGILPILQTFATAGLPIIGGFLSQALDTFNMAFDGITVAFNDLWATVISPTLSRFTTEGLPKVVDFLSMALGNFEGFRDSVTTVLGDVWNKAILPILQTFSNTGLPMIGDFIWQAIGALNNLYNEIKSLFDLIWSDAIAPALESIAVIWDGLWTGLKDAWDKWGDPIFSGINEAIDKTAAFFRQMWNEWIKPVWDKFMSTVDEVWSEHLKPLWDKITDFVGHLAAEALNIYNNFIMPILNWLSKVLKPLWDFWWDKVFSVVKTIFAAVEALISPLIDAFSGLVDFISGIFTGDLEKALGGIKEFFRGIINAIIGFFESFVNFFVEAINFVTGGISLVSGAVGDLIGVDLRIPEVSKVTLPRLATGGVIPPNREFLAVLGDQKSGTNIEAPLDTIVQAMQIALANGNGGSKNEAVFEVDGNTFARLVYKYANRENNRIGVSLAGGMA